MSIYKSGLIVAVLLGVSTILEYVWAAQVSSASVRVVGLSVESVVNAGLIAYYFMHVYQLWRAEEAH